MERMTSLEDKIIVNRGLGRWLLVGQVEGKIFLKGPLIVNLENNEGPLWGQ